MKTTKVNFSNRQGDKLAARLEMPTDSHPHTFALFAHCFTCNKNLTAVRNIARALTQEGFAVLRFDFTGLGESEGDFADTNFSSNVEDLVSAAQFLAKEYQAPKLLIGHSLGGAAVLLAKKHLPEVQAVATVGAPYQPSHVSHLFEDGIAEIKQEGIAKVNIGGRGFTIKKQFVDDLESLDSSQSPIKKLGAALLVLHSPQDSTVGIENAENIYKAAHHPKSYVSLDGADHLLMKAEDSLYVGDVIATWAKRYIELPKEDQLRTSKQVVVRVGEEGYTADIKAGNHYFTADEPADVGGNDFGPTPYDLLTASLGACTAMTLRMYADHKKWKLTEVRVHLNHGKTYIEDSGNFEGKGKKIDHIERVIELEGDLDDTQRARLLEIADRCPVHRTLHSEVVIDSKLG